jgi:predicted nucleic acid-binding protein
MRSVRGVLDSWAVLALVQGEPAAAEVEALIARACEGGRPLLMSTVNAGEVWYQIARQHSTAGADELVARLQRIGIEFVPAGWELTRIAADFKARFRLAYANCFAAALAKLHRAELVTGDPEFRQLGKEVSIRWLPR